jgi:DNA-binding IclR family transcriptional regulator
VDAERETAAMPNPQRQRPAQGIQSVEIAGGVLQALAVSGGAASLTEISRKAAMPTSKARRYLLSLLRIGLVEQNSETLQYGLGPLALQLGLAYLDRLNVVHVANQAALALRDEIRETICVSIWGPYGVSMVAQHDSPSLVHINVRIGWVVPLIGSATGRVFAVYLPRETTRTLLDKEIEQLARAHKSTVAAERKRTEKLLNEVRRTGLAKAPGNLIPGVHAYAAPVFDARGQIALALTVIGSQAAFAEHLEGEIAGKLLQTCKRLSRTLGYRSPSGG